MKESKSTNKISHMIDTINALTENLSDLAENSASFTSVLKVNKKKTLKTVHEKSDHLMADQEGQIQNNKPQ